MPVVTLFRALGEPTRLEMVKRLSSGHAETITTLTRGLRLSRQGVRKHLQILVDAEIIILKPQGRNTVVELDQQTLELGKKFITQLELRWEKHLLALREFVDERQ